MNDELRRLTAPLAYTFTIMTRTMPLNDWPDDLIGDEWYDGIN